MYFTYNVYILHFLFKIDKCQQEVMANGNYEKIVHCVYTTDFNLKLISLTKAS